MKPSATGTPADYDRRPYRTHPTLTRPYDRDEYDSPSAYRWWLASTLRSFAEAHTQLFAAGSSNDVVTLIVDPSDKVLGARIFAQFHYVGEPLAGPRRSSGGGADAVPVVVVPCRTECASRAVGSVDPHVARILGRPADEQRTWVVVAAAGGITVFDAPISRRLGEDDEPDMILNRYDTERGEPGPVPVAILL